MSEDTKTDSKSVCNDIDSLSQDELKKVLCYCKRKNLDFQMRDLESKYIESLKNKYKNFPQLVKFADGLKIIKLDKFTNSNKFFYNFVIEFCNVRKNCNDASCVHLKIKCEGENEDANGSFFDYPIFEFIWYRISCKNDGVNETNDICNGLQKDFADNEYNVHSDAVDDIIKVFLLDKKKLKIKRTNCLGFMMSKTEYALTYFLKDTIEYIADSLCKFEI